MLTEKTEAAALEVRERAKEDAASRRPPVPPRRFFTAERVFLWLLLGPTVVLVLAVVAYPFFYNVLLSLGNMNIYHIREWDVIGFGQYAAVFREPHFWTVLFKTVVWTAVNITFHVGLGVFLAVLLHQKYVRGKGAWRVLLILPWALPQYITALTWRGMFNYEYGAVNLLISEYLGMSPVAWLTSPFEAFVAVILTNIWLGFPFMMVVALGGLQSIPQELYEAADVDGASAWQTFRYITLPHLRFYLELSVLLGAIYVVNTFDHIYMMTQGGPEDSTDVVGYHIYKEAWVQFNTGLSAAQSFVLLAAIMVALVKRKKRDEHGNSPRIFQIAQQMRIQSIPAVSLTSRASAMKPPTIAPTAPMTIVISNEMFCFPGSTKRASGPMMIPATRALTPRLGETLRPMTTATAVAMKGTPCSAASSKTSGYPS